MPALDLAFLPAQSLHGLPHRLAIGWSGGADSTALLLLLKQLGHDVEAWHVDHRWSACSKTLAFRLSQQAKLWGIPFVTAALAKPAQKNREALARAGRMHCFQHWSRQRGLLHLCLGHHRQDQAETVAIRMLQGAGVYGLQAMRVQRCLGSLCLHRPLLSVRSEDLKAMLRQAGVSWWEDPSNADCSLLRNRIRWRYFPAIKAAGHDPIELMLRWQRQAVRLAAIIDAELDSWTFEQQHQQVSVAWLQWSMASTSLRVQALQRMAQSLSGAGVCLGRRHFDLIERWRCQGGQGGLDLSRMRLQRQKKSLILCLSDAKLCAA